MKKLLLFPFLIFSIVLFTGCSDDDNGGGDEKDTLVISFEGELAEANSEFSTTEGEVTPSGITYTTFNDPTNTLKFNYYHWGQGGLGGGFTYTNKTDKTTPGYTNTSAITAKGKIGTTYLTAYYNAFNPAAMTFLKPDLYTVKGVWVTNSTYAYLAMKDGNDDYKNNTKFEEGDYFTLTFIGYDKSGDEIDKVVFDLADFRDGKTVIVDEWKWVDLSKIAEAEVIKFEMYSTDIDENGMKTPSYFCLDGLTLEENKY